MKKNTNPIDREEIADRNREVLLICLDRFVSHGLMDTSVRDLSRSIKLQGAGIYWYFKNKEEAILSCAEEATNQLVNNLLAPAVKEITNPAYMIKRLYSRADEMAPTMRFFAQVCATPRYQKGVYEIQERLENWYQYYTSKFAQKLMCDENAIEPYVKMSISAMATYMMFGDRTMSDAIMLIVQKGIEQILERTNDDEN